MRDRWVAARRAEGRRRLVALGVAFAVVALGALAYLLARSSLFGVDTVRVRGATTTGAAAVRRAAAIEPGEPVLFVDEGAVARRVERVPSVASARVDAQFPDTVVITVTERAPVAWVRAATPPAVAVVDHGGRVLARTGRIPPGLPRVDGIGEPGAAGSHVADPGPFAALGALPPELRLATRVLRMEGDAAVALLRGAPPVAREIRFGPLTRMRAKAAAALGVIAELDRRGERVQYVDVRVPDSPATR
jgi:cell division protein FtsQ